MAYIGNETKKNLIDIINKNMQHYMKKIENYNTLIAKYSELQIASNLEDLKKMKKDEILKLYEKVLNRNNKLYFDYCNNTTLEQRQKFWYNK